MNGINTAFTGRRILCFGEILWDVLPDGRQPGGAPINVAYHLQKLGFPCSPVTKVGEDNNGRILKDLLQRWSLSLDFVQTDGEFSTSEVLVELDQNNDASYNILFPVAWDFIQKADLLTQKVKDSACIIYGSLSSRNEVSRDTLLEILDNDLLKVFDVNIRKPFINKEVLAKLLVKADIAKFNKAELQMISELFGGFYESEAEKVSFLSHEFELQEVLVTRGDEGAAYYVNDSVFTASGAAVEIVDTIGSGDAFLAAFLSSRFNGHDEQDIIKNATAMGAFLATKKGGCPEYEIEDFKNFKSKFTNQIQ